MREITIKEILSWLGVLAIAFLIFYLIKGCGDSKSLITQNEYFATKVEALTTAHHQDSINDAQSKKAYEFQAKKDKFEKDSLRQSLKKTQASLDQINNHAVQLIAAHKDIMASTDTTVTICPNDFVEQCHDCFATLQQSIDTSRKYQKQVMDLDSANRHSDSINKARIDTLTAQKDRQTNLAMGWQILYRSQASKITATRVFSLTIGAIAINNFLPKGAGGGFSYQDLKGRIFGAMVLGSSTGSFYIAHASTPLFKIKAKR